MLSVCQTAVRNLAKLTHWRSPRKKVIITGKLTMSPGKKSCYGATVSQQNCMQHARYAECKAICMYYFHTKDLTDGKSTCFGGVACSQRRPDRN